MTSNGFTSNSDFNSYLGCRLVDWGKGTSCIELEIEPHHLNSQGIGHGGVLLSLLDSACGSCGNTNAPPAPRSMSVTISLSANFVHPMRGTVLQARGRMTGGGRSIYYADATIHDETGQLIATASGAFKRVGKPSVQGGAGNDG